MLAAFGLLFLVLLLKSLLKPAEFLVLVIGLSFIVEILQLPQAPTNLAGWAKHFIQILLTFNIAWACDNLVTLLEHWLSHWAEKTESTLDDQLT